MHFPAGMYTKLALVASAVATVMFAATPSAPAVEQDAFSFEDISEDRAAAAAALEGSEDRVQVVVVHAR